MLEGDCPFFALSISEPNFEEQGEGGSTQRGPREVKELPLRSTPIRTVNIAFADKAQALARKREFAVRQQVIHFTIPRVAEMLFLPTKKHHVVKYTSPLYDSAGAQNAIPANKNAPNRKVDTLFKRKRIK